MNEALRSVTLMIAEQLGEAGEKPLDTIYSALEILGVMRVQTLLHEAMAIEAQGGMEVDGRRRTLGGVFFKHLKTVISRAELRRLRKKRMSLKAQRQPSKMPVPVIIPMAKVIAPRIINRMRSAAQSHLAARR